MEQNGDKDSNKTKAKYIWDPQKLAWVETGETPPEEERAQIAKEEEGDEAVSEEISEEGGAVEAAVEAVPLQYQGVWVRLAGALVDLVILTIIGVIISYTVGRAVGGLPNYSLPIYGLLYLVGFWSWRGQTPGKMLIGAKVVRRDGRPIDIGRAFARYVFYLMPLYAPITFVASMAGTWTMILLPIIGLVVEGLNREKRGIHDFIAGTVVINSRAPKPQPVEAGSADVAEATESVEPPVASEPGIDKTDQRK
jgi:uncharacterized RDD family membrane protein YckC